MLSNRSDVDQDAKGNNLSNPTGSWHNNAETQLIQPEISALIAADATVNFWFDAQGNAKFVSYSDILPNPSNLNKVMGDTSEINKKRNILLFDPVAIGEDLTIITRYLNH